VGQTELDSSRSATAHQQSNTREWPHRESNPRPPETALCALTTELQCCYGFNSCNSLLSFNTQLPLLDMLSRHIFITTSPKVCHYSAQSLGSFAAQPLDVLQLTTLLTCACKATSN
jgi:hypothetical protein